MGLTELGWTSQRQAEFEALTDTAVVPARVSLEHNHVYRVLTETGELLAEAAGRIKHLASGRNELPAVGDWVAARLNPSGRAVIRAILPRRSWFSRKAAGRETEEQVIAANVDTVLIVFGLDIHVKPRAIERYLTLARRSQVRPVVILNKSDLAEDVAADIADAVVVAGDAPVHAVSAKDLSTLSVLSQYLITGETIAFLGPSGAGKSSLVNQLMGDELLSTGAVRQRDNRGRHTSVHRQLLVLPQGGLLIDTPGMRELQLWNVDESLDETFGDVLELSPGCKFRDCQHESEPGCAVKTAVEEGTLAADRYASYLQLKQEHAVVERLRDERSAIDAKRQARLGSKALKSMQKLRGR